MNGSDLSNLNLLALSGLVSGADWPQGLAWGPEPGQYAIGEVEPKYFIIVRLATGSIVKVTWASVHKVLARLANGERVIHGATVRAGGISTTSAKSWGVMVALRDLVTWDGAGWTLSAQGQQRLGGVA